MWQYPAVEMQDMIEFVLGSKLLSSEVNLIKSMSAITYIKTFIDL